jgi:hypothetical protein
MAKIKEPKKVVVNCEPEAKKEEENKSPSVYYSGWLVDCLIPEFKFDIRSAHVDRFFPFTGEHVDYCTCDAEVEVCKVKAEIMTKNNLNYKFVKFEAE